MSELAKRENLEIANPVTGELIPLNGPMEDIVGLHEALVECARRLQDQKIVVVDELVRRLDRANTKSMEIDPGWQIKMVGTRTKTEWDIEALQEALEKCVKEGALEPDAARDALKPSLELKPDARKLKDLMARDDIGERIRACRREIPKRRTVTVKDAGNYGVSSCPPEERFASSPDPHRHPSEVVS